MTNRKEQEYIYQKEIYILVRCWGARGSVPVSGRVFEKYGGDTTCIQIETSGNEVIIVDAGTGIRELGNRLIRDNRKRIHLLLTHFHWDHIQGFPFFKPAYQDDVEIHVYGMACEGMTLNACLESVISPPHFPIPPDALKAVIQYHPLGDQSVQIGGTPIRFIPLNHPNGGVGYRIEENAQSFVFLTDNELCHPNPGGPEYQAYAGFAENADLLIHDAEYLPAEYISRQGWGHSTVDDAVRLALEANAGKLGLFHHHQDRSDDELDTIVEHAVRLAGRSSLRCFAVRQGMEIQV